MFVQVNRVNQIVFSSIATSTSQLAEYSMAVLRRCLDARTRPRFNAAMMRTATIVTATDASSPLKPNFARSSRTHSTRSSTARERDVAAQNFNHLGAAGEDRFGNAPPVHELSDRDRPTAAIDQLRSRLLQKQCR